MWVLSICSMIIRTFYQKLSLQTTFFHSSFLFQCSFQLIKPRIFFIVYWIKYFTKQRSEVSLYTWKIAHVLCFYANFPTQINTFFWPLVWRGVHGNIFTRIKWDQCYHFVQEGKSVCQKFISSCPIFMAILLCLGIHIFSQRVQEYVWKWMYPVGNTDLTWLL